MWEGRPTPPTANPTAPGESPVETLRWARENGCAWNADACLCAAQTGHLEVLQWLRANGCPWDAETCYQAADDLR